MKQGIIEAKGMFRVARLIMVLAMALSVSRPVPGQMIKDVPYDEMAATGIKPTETHVTLDPLRGWVNSGVFVKEGDYVNITASGLIDPGVRLSRGPDGAGEDLFKEMTHQCRYMELLGRIADGPLLCVGSNKTFQVVTGGQISFHVNELDTIRYDDLGSFEIGIRVVSPAPGAQAARAGALMPVTAVLGIYAVNMSESDGRNLSQAVRSQIAWANRFTLVDQAQVDLAISKLGYSPAQLQSPETAARAGQVIGAAKVITGQVGAMGDKGQTRGYTVTLQVIDTATGKVDKSVVDVLFVNREQLPARLDETVKKLSSQ